MPASVMTGVVRFISRSFSSMTCPLMALRTTKMTRVGSTECSAGALFDRDVFPVAGASAVDAAAVASAGDDDNDDASDDNTDAEAEAEAGDANADIDDVGVSFASPEISFSVFCAVFALSCSLRSSASILQITVSGWQGGGGCFFELAGIAVG